MAIVVVGIVVVTLVVVELVVDNAWLDSKRSCDEIDRRSRRTEAKDEENDEQDEEEEAEEGNILSSGTRSSLVLSLLLTLRRMCEEGYVVAAR